MHNHSDSAGDLAVSFDAFKVSRHDDGKRWEVRALTPWAQEMLIRHANTLPRWTTARPSDHVQWIRGKADRIHGYRTARRSDALDLLRDVEKTAERWSA